MVSFSDPVSLQSLRDDAKLLTSSSLSRAVCLRSYRVPNFAEAAFAEARKRAGRKKSDLK
jgi:hypothetical protein